MELSYELFQQIISELRADTGEREKRAEPRVGLSCEASFVTRAGPGGETAHRRVMVRDLSRSGVGLVCGTAVAVNRNIMVELPSAHGSCWIVCTTVYCQKLDAGLFKVGCRHNRVLQPAEVAAFTSQINRGSASAREQADRIRVTMLD